MFILIRNGKIPQVRLAVKGHNVTTLMVGRNWPLHPSATLGVESGKYALGQCRN